LGHLNHENMKKLNPLIKKMDLKDSDFQWIPTGLCAFCCTVKLRKRIPEESQNHIKKVLDRIYTDYWKSSNIENLIHLEYFILIIDESTRYYWIKIINTRTAKGLIDLMKSFINRTQRQYNQKIKFWHTDNAKKFISDFF
jgi:hypothetical protein